MFHPLLPSHCRTSALHRGESRLLRPLPQKRRRLPRRPGRGRELSHRLPAGRRRAWSQSGCGDGRPGRPPLSQPGAAEQRGGGPGPQQAPEELSVWKNC